MYKIAICDDDKNYREKIEKVIETEGILPKSEIRFYEYESGKELLENADILHDLVFMDMRMPGLDGNKSVLKLREYNRAAILVFCSGYFEPTPDSINIGQPFRYIMKDLHDRNVMLPSVKETFEQIWPDAVKKALEILFKQNRTEKMSMAQYQIYVSKLWSEICQKVGYMNIVDYDNFGDIKSIFYDLEKRHLIKKENDGIE